MKRGIVNAFAISMALATIAGIWHGYNSFVWQINNSIRLQQYAAELRKAYRENGRYPPTFDGTDFGGRPVIYLTDGATFRLVSFGRDRQPDAAYTLTSHFANANTCWIPSRDTVFDEHDPVRYCLK